MKLIHTLPIDMLARLPEIEDWDQVQALVKRAAATQPADWELPLLGCAAAGGDPEQAKCAVSAIAYAQIGIILDDDMLDADPRGEYWTIGMPATANLASEFQAMSLQVLLLPPMGSSLSARLNAIESLNGMMLTTAYGQYLDSQNPSTEAAYWRVVKSKSSPFFGAALQIGALLGGASQRSAAQIKEFGRLYGEMIQLHDDLKDTMAKPANPDWVLGRAPLPILYAQSVDHPERQRFLELRQAIPDPQALAEAQEILIRCGGLSYTIHHLLLRYQRAETLLAGMKLPQRVKLDKLLKELMKPVWKLFKETGVPKNTQRFIHGYLHSNPFLLETEA